MYKKIIAIAFLGFLFLTVFSALLESGGTMLTMAFLTNVTGILIAIEFIKVDDNYVGLGWGLAIALGVGFLSGLGLIGEEWATLAGLLIIGLGTWGSIRFLNNK